MSARHMRRCPHGHAFEWAELESFAEVRCDAPDCEAVVTDRFGWSDGSRLGVPPGWTRVTTETRSAEGTREGFFTDSPRTTTVVHDFCPEHSKAGGEP